MLFYNMKLYAFLQHLLLYAFMQHICDFCSILFKFHHKTSIFYIFALKNINNSEKCYLKKIKSICNILYCMLLWNMSLIFYSTSYIFYHGLKFPYFYLIYPKTEQERCTNFSKKTFIFLEHYFWLPHIIFIGFLCINIFLTSNFAIIFLQKLYF